MAAPKPSLMDILARHARGPIDFDLLAADIGLDIVENRHDDAYRLMPANNARANPQLLVGQPDQPYTARFNVAHGIVAFFHTRRNMGQGVITSNTYVTRWINGMVFDERLKNIFAQRTLSLLCPEAHLLNEVNRGQTLQDIASELRVPQRIVSNKLIDMGIEAKIS